MPLLANLRVLLVYPALVMGVILYVAHIGSIPFLGGGLTVLAGLAGVIANVIGRFVLWLVLGSDHSLEDRVICSQGAMNLIRMSEGVIIAWALYWFFVVFQH